MDTNDSSSALPFGTRVEIGGRTMLRPGFSLVGLTGMVYLTSSSAPAGCTTIAVDWNAHGYTPEKGYPAGSLPPLVNVPTMHLTLLDENGAPLVPEKPKAAPKPAPAKELPALTPLRKLSNPDAPTETEVSKTEAPTPEAVTSEAGKTEEPKSKGEAPSPDDDEPTERPRLRLV